MVGLDSSAFLSFVFFYELLECYTGEATSASYFYLFLLFCCRLPVPANMSSSSGLSGNNNTASKILSKTSKATGFR